ncbi:MAG: AAA family ATPase, partial [Actinomycetes bacterium]
MNRDRPSLAQFSRYLPDVARQTAVVSGEPLTRQSVTMFADIAGFTTLSERLARFGTAGTEQVGDILRQTIGGALDIVASWGGDALAFGGDAITVEFPARDSVWENAQAAAAEIVALFESVAGTDTLAGPVGVTVRIGISGGRVTSLLCPGRLRDVLVQIGPGLDRAADASAIAARNGMVIDDDWYTATGSVAIASGVRGTRRGGAQMAGPVPVWAPRLFHPLTASRIASAAEPPDEHRRMTCAFLSLPPTDDQDSVAVASLTDFVSRAADLIAEAGGDVVQCSGGDKGIVLYAVFGAPLAHPDDPLRAVHAVDQIRTATQQSFSAGISTGLAFTAVFGVQQRGFPSAIGDTTNVAARLMSAAEPGSTLLDGPTATSGGERLATDEPRAMSVKNRDEPIEAFRFRELSRSYLELDDEAVTPLVGREAELIAGERLLDTAAHAGGVLHLSGEAGSGKSRLAAEMARRARIRGLVVRTSAFEAFGVSRPFGPFADFVRERPGLRRIVTDHDLATAIAAVRPGDENLAPLLGSLLGLEERETAATVGLTADQRSELGRRLLVDLLCASATPTLLVLEDLHWGDEASLRLLADLSARLPLTSVSMVTTRRPMHIPGCVPV